MGTANGVYMSNGVQLSTTKVQQSAKKAQQMEYVKLSRVQQTEYCKWSIWGTANGVSISNGVQLSTINFFQWSKATGVQQKYCKLSKVQQLE